MFFNNSALIILFIFFILGKTKSKKIKLPYKDETRQCSAVSNRDVATYLIHIIVIEHPNSKGQLISEGSLVLSILPKNERKISALVG